MKISREQRAAMLLPSTKTVFVESLSTEQLHHFFLAVAAARDKEMAEIVHAELCERGE